MVNVSDSLFDAVIIGGGFYGAAIAIYLAKVRKFKRIVIIEKEHKLLSRASYNNQARVHNGYHYPRSFTTAYRSRINLPRFIRDWPEAIKSDFNKLYAIARRNSKVTARQFERFCRTIDAKIQIADDYYTSMFESKLIEAVFKVEEYAFDTTVLATCAEAELADLEIEILFESTATSIFQNKNKTLTIDLNRKDEQHDSIVGRHVFNCTYSGLNQFYGDYLETQTRLKHEITEMALMKMPDNLKNLGVTVMDGPFFSFMPFPARGLHTLSHVRYTPHNYWNDKRGINPYDKISNYNKDSRIGRMVRDVTRYVPSIENSVYEDSLFEVKTILVKNEKDDGRPILFERHPRLRGLYSILGGKIDNIYDVFEKLDKESF